MARPLEDLPPDAAGPLRHILDGIEPREGHGFVFEGGPSFRVTALDSPPVWMTYFILTRVLGAPDLGIHEKLAWQCTLRVDGVDCSVAHQKFGLRMYVAADQVEDEAAAAALAGELMSRLRRAVGIVERSILQEVAKEQVANGRVTIDCQHDWFWQMYTFFRERSVGGLEEARTTVEPPPIVEDLGNGVTLRTFRGLSNELRRNARFDAIAALSAYFSLLEHLFVMALAFSDFDPTQESLERFIGDRWGDKFKRVASIDEDASNERAYTLLNRLAEQLRNPQAHGGFDHQQSRIHFHLPGVGAVPARLSRFGSGARYSFEVEVEADPGSWSFWGDLDEFHNWLVTGPLRHAWRFGECDLDMAFDPDSLRELRIAVAAGDDEFEEYLEVRQHLRDQAMDMDF